MRDRVIDLRRVPAGELRPAPANWRTHPRSQREALREMLDRVGVVDAVVARETPDGLELVDGHLRADLAAGETLPVLVVDLTDAEAAEALATLDPIGAMAEADTAALRDLLGRLEAEPPLDHAALYGADAEPVPALPPTAPRDQLRPPGRFLGSKVRAAHAVVAALPDDHECYLEPFAGGLAVLLARRPARRELANDLNGDVVAFWSAVRDSPEELARRVAATPSARAEMEDCAARLADGGIDDPVERARCFVVASTQSHLQKGAAGELSRSWRRYLTGGDRSWHGAQEADWLALAERLREVHLECDDGVRVLADAPGTAVVYCDPPYPSADRRLFREVRLDGFEEAALAAAGRGCRVAVSGYPGDWPALEERWRSVRWTNRASGAIHGADTTPTEVLWLSYEPDLDRLAEAGITRVEEPE